MISTFTGIASGFLRSPLYQLFCTETTLTPEVSEAGKIIILDLPVKEFNEAGRAAQVLFKYLWQRWVERRQITPQSRPVFLWADESQYFVNEHDASFQTTARSARACTVFLTQNIPNYYAMIGGGDAKRAFVDSLVGNLTTKFFHNNSDTTTNKWAAELFAQDWQQISGHSIGLGPKDGGASVNLNNSQQLVYTVPPRAFTNLAKGGPLHDFGVEAIVHQGGKIFAGSGLNALRTRFSQR
ncbi:MAG: hypothetical protein Q7P63_12320 [Verrucomicrobiota bacterium JB022]|nr:hypothetical protein [Verrucomicrobiota bacterium JB022]